MTREERKQLAQQLESNPLFEDILSRMEEQAVGDLIWRAPTEADRIEAQKYAQAIKKFRDAFKAHLATKTSPEIE